MSEQEFLQLIGIEEDTDITPLATSDGGSSGPDTDIDDLFGLQESADTMTEDEIREELDAHYDRADTMRELAELEEQWNLEDTEARQMKGEHSGLHCYLRDNGLLGMEV